MVAGQSFSEIGPDRAEHRGDPIGLVLLRFPFRDVLDVKLFVFFLDILLFELEVVDIVLLSVHIDTESFVRDEKYAVLVQVLDSAFFELCDPFHVER